MKQWTASWLAAGDQGQAAHCSAGGRGCGKHTDTIAQCMISTVTALAIPPDVAYVSA